MSLSIPADILASTSSRVWGVTFPIDSLGPDAGKTKMNCKGKSPIISQLTILEPLEMDAVHWVRGGPTTQRSTRNDREALRMRETHASLFKTVGFTREFQH